MGTKVSINEQIVLELKASNPQLYKKIRLEVCGPETIPAVKLKEMRKRFKDLNKDRPVKVDYGGMLQIQATITQGEGAAILANSDFDLVPLKKTTQAAVKKLVAWVQQLLNEEPDWKEDLEDAVMDDPQAESLGLAIAEFWEEVELLMERYGDFTHDSLE